MAATPTLVLNVAQRDASERQCREMRVMLISEPSAALKVFFTVSDEFFCIYAIVLTEMSTERYHRPH